MSIKQCLYRVLSEMFLCKNMKQKRSSKRKTKISKEQLPMKAIQKAITKVSKDEFHMKH